MVGVEELDGILIVKHRLRLFERNAMLSSIQCGLTLIPLKADLIYMYNVNIPFLRAVFKKFSRAGDG